MDKGMITPDLRMAEIIETWPETIPVFMGYRMICVGCLMSQFDTLEESLKIYNLPVDKVIDELNQLIRTSEEEYKD